MVIKIILIFGFFIEFWSGKRREDEIQLVPLMLIGYICIGQRDPYHPNTDAGKRKKYFTSESAPGYGIVIRTSVFRPDPFYPT